VGATDKRAESADLQAEPSITAGGTRARIAAILRLGKNMRPEQLVQCLEHLGDSKLADVVHRGDELAPEVAEHVLPLELARRHDVKLLLKVGGGGGFDIAAGEAFRGHGEQGP